jgi:hypothetical protein
MNLLVIVPWWVLRLTPVVLTPSESKWRLSASLDGPTLTVELVANRPEMLAAGTNTLSVRFLNPFASVASTGIL